MPEVFEHESMEDQVRRIFQKKSAIGESRKKAVRDGTFKDKIFSQETFDDYLKNAIAYCRWAEETHGVHTVEEANSAEYINEYLNSRINRQGKPWSAWSLKLSRCAIAKLYGETGELNETVPCAKCKSENMVRSRNEERNEKYFASKKYQELVNFVTGTGLCRKELENLRGEEDKKKLLRKRKDGWYLHVTETTSKVRAHWAPIIGEHADDIVARIRNTAPGEKVWKHIQCRVGIQNMRLAYARALYKAHAREENQIVYSEKFYCRGDRYGDIYDKAAMKVVADAFGLVNWRFDALVRTYLF